MNRTNHTGFPSNSSSNGSLVYTSSCTTIHDSDTAKVMKTVALCTIFLFALIANSLVIAVFAKIKSLQKGINFFFVNMAASDIIIPIVFIPKEIVDVITASGIWRVEGSLGLALCKLQPFLIDVCSVVSVLSMMWITVDRFRAVVMPLRFTALDGIRPLLISSTWIIASLIYIPYFYAHKLWPTAQGEYLCITDWSPLDHFDSTLVFVVLVLVLFGIMPWLLATFLYSLIIIELKQSRVRVSTQNEGPLRHQDRSIGVIKQALAITAAFSVCYFPLVAFYFTVAFVNKFMCSPLPYWGHLFFTAKVLVLSNTVINPCICLFFNANYRNGLRSVLSMRVPERVCPTSLEMGPTRARASTAETMQNMK